MTKMTDLKKQPFEMSGASMQSIEKTANKVSCNCSEHHVFFSNDKIFGT